MSHNVTQVAGSLHNFTPNDYVSTRSEDRPHTIGLNQLLESIKFDDSEVPARARAARAERREG